ncbi:MAG: DNA-3-methyladenine glycosylase 2 family protein [Anaerolineales bacterium]|nr:DNA-3-methyladenine glycosylase 2 family protein [Anaerolineales bacterium]MCK5635110.1 DNA-3-methyladenine glycosylase 2 family protein [Anaerolineales bacterium]
MDERFNRTILTEKTYSQGISELITHHSDLAEAVLRWGHPPFWTHTPGFQGLVLAILSQQVSLESAQATFTKLGMRIDPINPDKFLSLNEHALREIGFSHQKASYIRGIANGIRAGDLNLDDLESLKDDQVRNRLVKVRGIGAWTADTYLLFSLSRSDAWPSGDLALAKAIQELRGLISTPDWDEVDKIAEDWKPWRAVAARILWHHYLNERGRNASA